MNGIQIIDVEGQWVNNPHAFAFVDPETGVRFSPGVLTKISYADGSWIETQIYAGTLAEGEDPLKPKAPDKPSKAPPKAETPKGTGKAEG